MIADGIARHLSAKGNAVDRFIDGQLANVSERDHQPPGETSERRPTGAAS